jgi:hypothetical protein
MAGEYLRIRRISGLHFQTRGPEFSAPIYREEALNMVPRFREALNIVPRFVEES